MKILDAAFCVIFDLGARIDPKGDKTMPLNAQPATIEDGLARSLSE